MLIVKCLNADVVAESAVRIHVYANGEVRELDGAWPFQNRGATFVKPSLANSSVLSEPGDPPPLLTTPAVPIPLLPPFPASSPSPPRAPPSPAPRPPPPLTTPPPLAPSPPYWETEPLPGAYERSMSLTVVVVDASGAWRDDGVLLAYNRPSALVNRVSALRGYQDATTAVPAGPNAGRGVYSITVWGDDDEAGVMDVEFVYVLPSGEERAVTTTVPFVSGGVSGDVFAPVELALAPADQSRRRLDEAEAADRLAFDGAAGRCNYYYRMAVRLRGGGACASVNDVFGAASASSSPSVFEHPPTTSGCAPSYDFDRPRIEIRSGVRMSSAYAEVSLGDDGLWSPDVPVCEGDVLKFRFESPTMTFGADRFEASPSAPLDERLMPGEGLIVPCRSNETNVFATYGGELAQVSLRTSETSVATNEARAVRCGLAGEAHALVNVGDSAALVVHSDTAPRSCDELVSANAHHACCDTPGTVACQRVAAEVHWRGTCCPDA